MGLNTALFTSLSGMTANSKAISVIGNNIANVNTTGFKASRASFETQVSQSLSNGSGPTSELGGSNPSQIGLGTRIGSVTRNFQTGSLQPTGINTDLAIEGNGFFSVVLNGSTRFTRDGSFSLDSDFNLVNSDGGLVQGFGVDDEFNVIEGVLRGINIPIGALTLAEATRTVQFAGNLNAGGDATTTGSIITSEPLFADTGATTAALTTDSLDSLFDAAGNQRFAVGDVITVNGAQKGGATLANQSFEVGATNTTGADAHGTALSDLTAFLEGVLGIDTTVNGGVSISALGELTIEGNGGLTNDILLEEANFILNQSSSPTLPLQFSKQASADGESVRTTFVAFDSLGTPMTIDLNIVLEDKTNTGTKWRFYAQSEDDTDLSRVLGNGTVEFNTNGHLVTMTDADFVIDRADTGAFTPQQVTIQFSDSDATVSALASTSSQLSAVGQDGSSIGTLEDFNVSADGSIVGVFSNSLLRTLGQITMSQFPNPQGLEDVGGNLFRITVNSGIAAIVTPGSAGSGRIVGGALELANVELSQEFIALINASTGFTANSRVLSTTDRLLQDLLNIVR
jgi:flagellar hook protein FlgE